MIYTTCRYAPDELFVGFKQEVSKLDPSPATFSCAEGCGHPNLCSYVKAIIEEVLTKNIKELVLTDCCDATRRAYDILKNSGQLDFLYLLPLPHKNGERDIKYFEASLIDLIKSYENYSKITFNEELALQACLENYKEERKHPKGDYIRLAGAHGSSALLKEIKNVFPNTEIVNDTCTGNRHLDSEVEKDNFLSSYANILLNQATPCMRMWFNGNRSIYEEKPKGTIFHTIKFCDYYSFSYMHEKDGITHPMLKIETESIAKDSGQLNTRLEAFNEEIMSKKINDVNQNGYVMGIDIGSTSTDIVIMDKDKNILASSISLTGVGNNTVIEDGKKKVLEEVGIQESDLDRIVTTGYGRKTTGLNAESVTEITCHAKGAHYLYPDARTVIDIGGQDSKVISIDENGKVLNFVMNDKCAAGTGRFLEAQAKALGLSMNEMSKKGLEWHKDIEISSMCTVFAESEVISLVAEKNTPEDIIHGLNKSIANRVFSLVQRAEGKEAYILTGGVAQNEGVQKCLEEKLKTKIYVSEKAQLCGAIGAALMALE